MAKQGKEYRESSTAMARSLERVVRPPRLQRDLWTAGRTDVDSGGGMTGPAAGDG